MIKILRIINRFNLGGPTFNVTFLAGFLPSEFETKLYGGIHEDREGDALFIPKKYGVEAHIIPAMRRAVHLQKDFEAYQAIRRVIQEFKPDVVHTHASKAGALGRLAAFKEKVPVVVHTFHGHVFHSYFGRYKTMFYKAVERYLAGRTDAIVAISELQKRELVDVYRIEKESKFKVIPLGFDLKKFQLERDKKRELFRSKYGLEMNEIAIGIIGRLTPIKNHELFLNVMEKLKNSSVRKMRAFIVGDGELKEEIMSHAKRIENRIGEHIFEFTSWVQDIDDLLPGLDIVCLTSHNEGTPVSLIESQAAGVPVVSTDVGGVRDVIQDGVTGRVVKKNDPKTYAAVLAQLVNQDRERMQMAKNGWHHVKDKYNYSRLCSEMGDLYKELLAKKTGFDEFEMD